MPELEKEMFCFIGREIHELSWCCDYPINPDVSLWSFIQAFQENDFNVKIDDKKKELFFSLETVIKNKEIKSLLASSSYEEILFGWKNHPKYSPQSLYDSICVVYDKIEQSFIEQDNHEESNHWFLKRNKETKEIKESMKKFLLPYFIEHHEHMLIPLSGKIPELKEPVIFKEIIDTFPMNVFRNSIIYKPSFGPCAENIPELDLEKDLDIELYYPSETSMTEYFLGRYLYELSGEKNYPLYYDQKDKLRELIMQKERAFRSGSLIKWGV